MTQVVDQLKRTVTLHTPVQRIVSLVPSLTELLADLGLDEQVVGLTRYCCHPPDWRRHANKTVVGGTKNVDVDRTLALRPDLVIASKEENVREQVEALAEHVPVWVSDVQSLADSLEVIASLGAVTGTATTATAMQREIEAAFAKLEAVPAVPCLYLIWRKPFMAVGGDTFIHSMVTAAGFDNLLASRCRYPELTLAEMQSLNPKAVLLSSEPYPFKEQHVAEIQAALPDARVMLVDGEYFSWYGSRLGHAAAYFEELRARVPALDVSRGGLAGAFGCVVS